MAKWQNQKEYLFYKYKILRCLPISNAQKIYILFLIISFTDPKVTQAPTATKHD